tara:strand:- start:51 stop:203 length:153 start_codon:yes stop_codon:yes gene_type:complete
MGKTNRHPVTNKLKHSVRHNRLWKMKIEKDRKKENKKTGDLDGTNHDNYK